MTTITFDRTGGIVGNEVHLELRLEDLSEDEAQRLQKLIDDADFFGLPENLAGRASPDEFQYLITVENGGDRHSVRATDTTVPEALRLLIKELTMIRLLH
jgi:hypothetical protein